MQFKEKLMNQTWQNGKKPNFGPDFGPLDTNQDPQFFSWVLPLLGVRHCHKLSLHAIPRENIWSKTQENDKKPHFGPDLIPVGSKFGLPIFLKKNLTSSVTRYHGQLSLRTISEKTNDPI